MPQQAYTFDNPVRPPAVRTFCALGQGLRRWGWERPLAATDIVRRAQRRSGLKDWGDDFFLEPLERLVEAFEAEANLTPFGRWFIRELLIGMVRRRLQIHDYLCRHPDALQARLRDPLIVVGMPRTGTTLLFNLLCQDPSARPLMRWESLQPAPPRPRLWGGDARIRYSRFSADILHWLAPALDQIHPIDPLGPEECTWLMANTFISPAFGMFGRIPGYDDWLWSLEDRTWERVYEDYVTQLLILQHQKGGAGHWVLKSPVHVISLGPLLSKIPEARVILTCRDPEEVVPSACSLYAVLRGIGTDQLDRVSLGSELLDNLAKAAQRAEVVQAQYPERVMHIRYQDMTNNKIPTIRAIYAHFDIAFTESVEVSLTRFLAQSRHVKNHSYELSQFGLTSRQVQERFSEISCGDP